MARKRRPCGKCSGESLGGESSNLGLDELMIVNPGTGAPPDLFVGDDGALYRVSASNEQRQLEGLGLFVGDDGSVYRAEAAPSGSGGGVAGDSALDGFLLSSDGTLYRISKSTSE